MDQGHAHLQPSSHVSHSQAPAQHQNTEMSLLLIHLEEIKVDPGSASGSSNETRHHIPMVPRERGTKVCETLVVVPRATGHQHRGSSRRGILGAKENFAKIEKQILDKFILVPWMKISASASPSLPSSTNFTETDKEEEEDGAEEGPREGPGLAPATADPSTYRLEGTTWSPLPISHCSPQANTSPGWLFVLPTFHTEAYTLPSHKSSHIGRWKPQPKFYTS